MPALLVGSAAGAGGGAVHPGARSPARRLSGTAAAAIDPVFDLGRNEEAEKYARLGLSRAEEALRLHPEGSRPAQLAAPAAACLGDRAEAIRWIERALWIDPEDAQAQYNAACAWALLGEADRALDMLESWAKRGGVLAKNWLEHDPDLNPIRSHPRYVDLAERSLAERTEQVV